MYNSQQTLRSRAHHSCMRRSQNMQAHETQENYYMRAKFDFLCIIMVLVRSHLKDTLKWSTANSDHVVCYACVVGIRRVQKLHITLQLSSIKQIQPKWYFIFRFVLPCNRLFVKHSCCNIQLDLHGSLSLYSFTRATFCSAGAV